MNSFYFECNNELDSNKILQIARYLMNIVKRNQYLSILSWRIDKYLDKTYAVVA